MTIQEAIRARHSVRKYTDRPIETEKATTLRAEMERLNAASGLNIQLVLDEPRAFASGLQARRLDPRCRSFSAH